MLGCIQTNRVRKTQFSQQTVKLGFRKNRAKLEYIPCPGGMHALSGVNMDRVNLRYITSDCVLTNYNALRETLISAGCTFRTYSHGEAILHGYCLWGPGVLSRIQGQFSFVICSRNTSERFIARDTHGVTPLYYGNYFNGGLSFGSRVKSLIGIYTDNIAPFPPGCYMCNTGIHSYYTPVEFPIAHVDYAGIRACIQKSVDEYTALGAVALITDTFGSATLVTCPHDNVPYSIPIRSYSIYLTDIPVTVAYKRIDYVKHRISALGLTQLVEPECPFATVQQKRRHIPYTYTIEQAISVLSDVIVCIETYDVMEVRKSISMYILASKMEKRGHQYVMSDIGSDIFNGNSTNPIESHEKAVQRLRNISMGIVKCFAHYNIKVLFPYLRSDVVEYVMNLSPQEKYILPNDSNCVLRRAFSHLPESVVQCEPFVNPDVKTLADVLEAHANATITDNQFYSRSVRFPVNTPDTKEAYLYMDLWYTSTDTSSGITV